MRQVRSTLVLLLLCAATAQRADAGEPSRQACDVVCQVRTYFNTDHMTTLEPRTPPSSSSPSTFVGKDVRGAAPEPRAPRREARTSKLARLSTIGRTRIAGPAPTRSTIFASGEATARTSGGPRSRPTLLSTIPGGMPTLMARFAPPSS